MRFGRVGATDADEFASVGRDGEVDDPRGAARKVRDDVAGEVLYEASISIEHANIGTTLTDPEEDARIHPARHKPATVWQPRERADRVLVSRESGDAGSGLSSSLEGQPPVVARDLATRTSVFHILIVASAAVSRIESSGDHARHETGSVCSRKTLSSAKPACAKRAVIAVSEAASGCRPHRAR